MPRAAHQVENKPMTRQNTRVDSAPASRQQTAIRQKAHRKPSLLRWGCLAVLCIGLLIPFGLYAATSIWPYWGAMGADRLRTLLGNEAVAQVEAAAFQIRDNVQQLTYSLGVHRPAAPWQAPTPPHAASLSSGSTPTPSGAPIALPPLMSTPAPLAGQVPLPDLTSTPGSAETYGPTPTPWNPSPAASTSGSLQGEGVWTPYLQDAAGQTVAYRTFLRPDPSRPYSIVAIVAFDLTRTRLHFVLGNPEPSVPKGPKGTGPIPVEDRTSGALIATFNGGFKATHGHYGAMANGVVALPPRNGLGVVVLYADGRVRIGEWGRDIKAQTPDMVAWRENGPPIIQDGQITPQVYSNSIRDWGGTLDGKIVTWRSGLGISADNKILYYFAGPNLSMPALAQSMMAVHVYQGMLLDINTYWVHFNAVQTKGDQLTADPLLPEMKAGADRYLHPSSRDFFYVTTAQSAANP